MLQHPNPQNNEVQRWRSNQNGWFKPLDRKKHSILGWPICKNLSFQDSSVHVASMYRQVAVEAIDPMIFPNNNASTNLIQHNLSICKQTRWVSMVYYIFFDISTAFPQHSDEAHEHHTMQPMILPTTLLPSSHRCVEWCCGSAGRQKLPGAMSSEWNEGWSFQTGCRLDKNPVKKKKKKKMTCWIYMNILYTITIAF